MANAVKIANLQIEISDNSQTAIKSLSEFIEILKSMKEATSGNLGLSKVSSGLKKINEAGTDGIEALATSLAKAVAPAEKLAESLSHVSRALSSIKGSKSLSSAMQTAEKLQTQANTARNTNTRTGLTNDTSGTWNNTAQQTQQVNNALAEFQQRAEQARQTLAQIEMRDDLARGISEWTREAQRAYGASGKLKEAFLSVGRFGSEVFNNILPAGVSRLISQFGRMARMKVLRTIISNLMQGFSQGLQNAYYWAKATGDQFASSMDTISTSMNYAKNSIGAAFSSVLNIIAPVIDKVVDWLVVGINYINMFFATLSGASTYMKAKKVAVEYGTAAAGAIGGASAAAKDLKEQLSVLDFDELNQLQDQSASSGGGGGGGGAGGGGTNYGDMFEQAAIEQNWLTKTATWLKDNFETILDIVKAIGAGILAWKVADAFSNTIKELSAAQKLGFALLTIGVVLSYEGGYEMGKNGFTVKGLVESIVGVGLAAIGGTLLWGATGAIIGVTVAVVANLVGYIKGEREATATKWLAELKDKSVTYNVALNGIDDANTKLQKANDLLANVKSRSIEADETLNKISMGQALLDQIAKFDGKVALSNTDIIKLNGLVEAYNALELTDAVQWWTDVNGVIRTNVDEIQKAIDKYKEYARVTAYQNLLVEATTYQASAKAQMDQSAPYITAYENRISQLMEQLQNYVQSNPQYAGTYGLTHWQPGDGVYGNAVLQKDQTLFNLTTEINTLNEALGGYQETYDTASEAYSEASKQVEYFASQLGEATGEVSDFSTTVATQKKISSAIPVYNGLPVNNWMNTGQSQPIQAKLDQGQSQQWVAGMALPKNTSSTNTVTNNTVNSTTFTASTGGLATAIAVTQQYASEVNNVYTAEQRAQAYQIAYEQGNYQIAAAIKQGGAEAQKYTGYILDNSTAMQKHSTIVNDATSRVQSYTPAIKTAGQASQTSAGQVGMINTALGNVGTGVNYKGIYNGITNNFGSQNWASIGTEKIKSPIENYVNTTGSGVNGGTIYSKVSGLISAQPFSKIGTSAKGDIEGTMNKTGQGINASGIANTVTKNFNAQPWSNIGRNMSNDIIGGFKQVEGTLKAMIGNIQYAMQAAANAASWSSIGRTIGNDLKSGIANAISSMSFNTTAVANGVSKTITGSIRTALYASGGYPEAGSLFIAGEAGAEAVGTIGGKTGVANRDQIASAIAMALKPMLGGQNRETETIQVNTYLDSQVVARANAKGVKAMNRRYNITAKA